MKSDSELWRVGFAGIGVLSSVGVGVAEQSVDVSMRVQTDRVTPAKQGCTGGDKTRVVVALDNPAPAHVYPGSCPEPDGTALYLGALLRTVSQKQRPIAILGRFLASQ
jgi:hypothetical protein